MTAQNITTTKAQALLDRTCRDQAIPCTDGSLNWTEKLEGLAWSTGFRLAWLLVVTVMAPVQLLTGRSALEPTKAPLQRYPLARD